MRFHTSVTERASFRSCRRQWHLETVEHLAVKDRVQWHFLFGDAIHSALEAYYTNNRRSLASATTRFRNEWRKVGRHLAKEYGGLFSNIETEFDDYMEKGMLMLNYYSIYDEQAEFDWDKVIAVNIEERAFVDILDLGGFHQDNLPLLSGKIDLVVERSDGIWIVDHKTAASMHNSRALDIDDQLTGYCYVWWRLTGEVPRGAIYNVLIKEPPTPPRVLKSGELSQDKSQRTTYDLYMKSIHDLGLNAFDYTEILAFLKEKGWGQFYLRDGLQRNLEEIKSFEKRLYYEYKDMADVIAQPDKAYPNPTQRTCPGCPMMPLCQAMEEENAEFVKEHMYEEVPPRVKIPRSVSSTKWKGV